MTPAPRLRPSAALGLVLAALVAAGALRAAAPRRPAPSGGLAPADALLDRGDNAGAAAAYRALGPQSSREREGWRQNNWGLALLRMGQPARAVRHLREATLEYPSNFVALANLGAAWEQVGDLTKAIDLYRRALRLARARGGPAGGEQSAANPPAAEPAARPFPDDACRLPPARIRRGLARADALLAAGRYADAAAAYAALGRVPGARREGWRQNNWGLCCLRLADPSDARAHLGRSVRVFPGNPVAWNNLAVADEELGLVGQAAKAFARGRGKRGYGADPQRLELVRLKLAYAAARRRVSAGQGR